MARLRQEAEHLPGLRPLSPTINSQVITPNSQLSSVYWPSRKGQCTLIDSPAGHACFRARPLHAPCGGLAPSVRQSCAARAKAPHHSDDVHSAMLLLWHELSDKALMSRQVFPKVGSVCFEEAGVCLSDPFSHFRLQGLREKGFCIDHLPSLWYFCPL